MTDDEIMKALECCCNLERIGCEECLQYELHSAMCIKDVMNKALGLINRQNAEIERLKQENKEYCEDNRIIACQRNQRDKEIRALHNQLNGLNFMDKQIKSESVKKFAEKLKDSADKTRIKNMETEKVVYYMDEFKLDNLVKEMTEGQEK